MSTKVKSDSQPITRDDLNVTCGDIKGFTLFSIPKVAGVNRYLIRAVRKEVFDHPLVRSATLTGAKNLLVVPNQRSLANSSMSHDDFKEEIKEFIASSMLTRLNKAAKTHKRRATRTRAQSVNKGFDAAPAAAAAS